MTKAHRSELICCTPQRPRHELRQESRQEPLVSPSWAGGNRGEAAPLTDFHLETPQSAWGKSCRGNEKLQELPDSVLQGSLSALLEVHQKRAEQLHEELLARLEIFEARLLQQAAGNVCEEVESPEPKEEEEIVIIESEPGPAVEAKKGRLVHGMTAACALTSTTTGNLELPGWRGLRSKVRRCVRSPGFEIFASSLILVSVFISFLELEWEGYMADVELGLQAPGGWKNAEWGFRMLRYCFNFIFLVEFLLRCIAGGCLRDGWSWFDGFFVVASVLDDFVLALLSPGGSQNLGVMRLLRCARMARSFRAARSMRAVRPLLLLVQTILSSASSLLWSSILLFLVQLMGTIFVTKSLHSFIMDDRNSMEDRVWVNTVFGSGIKSIYTFFEITFSGGWPNHVRPLIDKAGGVYALFFVPYIAVWTFVIMRVIGALFIKNTLAMAEKVECARQSHEGERNKMMRRIAAYFKRADADGDGNLCWEELECLFEDPAVKSWCMSHEIDLDDAQNLWQLLNSKGSLGVTEFVDGMLRLREPAKAIDLKAVLQTVRNLASQTEKIHDKLCGLETARGGHEKVAFDLPKARKSASKVVITSAMPEM